MQRRVNRYFSHMINRSLIRNKLLSHDQAWSLLQEANLPIEVIQRVLDHHPVVRSTDYQ